YIFHQNTTFTKNEEFLYTFLQHNIRLFSPFRPKTSFSLRRDLSLYSAPIQTLPPLTSNAGASPPLPSIVPPSVPPFGP
ncbi:unnamed protein product, partial [Prunus brigantina]